MIAQRTKKIQKGLVNELTRVSKSLYLIRFTPHTPVDIKPGQFVSVLCDNLTLRRPFSVMDYEDGVISILFKKKGAGTAYISNLKQGDNVDFVGPMGNGFNIERKKSLLISAGVGSAPVFYLHKKMDELGIENFFASGFVSKEEIPSNLEFDMITTDDGSEGKKVRICRQLWKDRPPMPFPLSRFWTGPRDAASIWNSGSPSMRAWANCRP